MGSWMTALTNTRLSVAFARSRHSESHEFRRSLALPTRTATDASPIPSNRPRLAAKVARYTFLSAGLAPAVHARVSLARPSSPPVPDQSGAASSYRTPLRRFRNFERAAGTRTSLQDQHRRRPASDTGTLTHCQNKRIDDKRSVQAIRGSNSAQRTISWQQRNLRHRIQNLTH